MKSKGAISIFLILITLSSIIFGGLFIDASRILVAERKTQNVLNSATRSVLAGYDETLVGEFGIFAIKKENQNSEFKRYLNVNMSENHYGINFIDYNIESFKVNSVRGLLTDEAINEQIMEYMKYKGPINITTGVIERFQRIFSRNAKDALNSVKDTQSLFDQAKDSLGELGSNLKRFAEREFKQLANDIKKAAAEDINESIVSAIDDFDKVLNQLEKTISDINNYEVKIQEADAEMEKFISGYNDETNPDDKIDIDYVNLESIFEDDENNIKDQINEQIQNIEHNIKKLYEFNEYIAPPLVEKITSKEDEISQLEEEIEDILIKLKITSSERTSSNSNQNLNDALLDELEESQKELEKLKKELEELKKELDNKKNELLESLKQLEEISEVEDPKAKDVEEKSNEFATTEKITEIFNEYKKLFRSVDDNWFVSQTDVDDANKKIEPLGEKESFGIFNAISELNSLYEQFDKIINILEGGVTAIIKNVYQTEYIMDKFTFVTSTTERDHYWKRGEVEYIIFGHDSAIKNMSAGIASVFTIRFIINFIAEFVTNPSPEFISRVIASLALALIQSVNDMNTMLFGQGDKTGLVPISKKFPKIQVSYSDHLRILLLLSDKKLERIKDLMQINMIYINNEDEAYKLKNFDTSISAELTTSINLLFLPMFGVDKMGFDNFSDGRYYINKQVYMGY